MPLIKSIMCFIISFYWLVELKLNVFLKFIILFLIKIFEKLKITFISKICMKLSIKVSSRVFNESVICYKHLYYLTRSHYHILKDKYNGIESVYSKDFKDILDIQNDVFSNIKKYDNILYENSNKIVILLIDMKDKFMKLNISLNLQSFDWLEIIRKIKYYKRYIKNDVDLNYINKSIKDFNLFYKNNEKIYKYYYENISKIDTYFTNIHNNIDKTLNKFYT